jgi:hypothetical protein
VLQTVDKFSDPANLFSKNIFFKTKNFSNKLYYNKNLQNAIKTFLLLWPQKPCQEVKQVRGRGEGGGGSNELDAAWSAQSKFFFLILDLPGGSLWRA